MLLSIALSGPLTTVSFAQEVDDGVIKLGGTRKSEPAPEPDAEEPDADNPFGSARRGFDFHAFQARLETYWFQRKAFLAHGRDADADRQAELIRAFCLEEGVRRLEGLSSALITEARRYMREGDYSRATKSLDLAETFDPDRAQTRVARAALSYESGLGYVTTAGELIAALKLATLDAAQDMTLMNQLAIALVVGLLAAVVVFSLFMLSRYHVPLRHEIEELAAQRGMSRFGPVAGWAVVLLPFLIWIGAGWAAVHWIVVTFRYMARSERIAAFLLLIGLFTAVPAYRIAVALFGVTADPVVRTTLASAGGSYDPDRIVKLRNLVDAYPEDPIYHFLLAGLYKNGRYFEEAFSEYKEVLSLEPSIYQAHINIGNIFFMAGQHAEAIASYSKAVQMKPDATIALFNMHLAQSETFRFKDAEVSLAKAKAFDPEAVTALMSEAKDEDGRPTVVDAEVKLGSIWQSALEGRGLQQRLEHQSSGTTFSVFQQFVNPVSIMAVVAGIVCLVIGIGSAGQDPARGCIRCGRPFCHLCKRRREGHEYCSQCLHLFVIGDGLAPETKTRKLYEVERHERRNRLGRRVVSLFLPGAAHLLRGRAAVGCLLLVLWVSALISWRPEALVPIEMLAGIDLRLDLLQSGSVPAAYSLNPTSVIALFGAVAIWVMGNLWRWRRREL